MPNSVTINLLRAKSVVPQSVLKLESRVKKIATISLIFVICTGLILALVRYMLTEEEDKLTKQKSRIEIEIANKKTVEGLFVSIKNRADITSRVLASLKPLDDMYTLATSIAPPPVLTGLEMGADGKITMKMGLASLTDVGIVIDRVTELSDQGALIKPEMTSLGFDVDNGYLFVLTFFAGKINL